MTDTATKAYTPANANIEVGRWERETDPAKRTTIAMDKAVDVQVDYIGAIADVDLRKSPHYEELCWAINDLRWLIAQERAVARQEAA